MGEWTASLYLSMPNAPCNKQFYLDEALPIITIQVKDEFDNQVQGELLDSAPLFVQMIYESSQTDPSVGISVEKMNSTGYAQFSPFTFCTQTGSSIQLTVQAVNSTGNMYNQMDVQPILNCTFSIGACSKAADSYQPVQDTDNEQCDICVHGESCPFIHRSNTDQRVAVSPYNWKMITLIVASSLLCCLLIVVTGGFIGYKS